MANWLKPFFVALGITLVVAIAGVVLAVIVQTTGSHTDGIDTFAGGLSQRFLNIFLPGLFILFVIILLLLWRKQTQHRASN